jgi:alanine racemase
MLSRPIQAFIDRDAIRNNVAIIQKLSGSSKVFGVVKFDGYGHGLKRIYPALSELDGFAVLEIEAACYLRNRDKRRPILLLEGFFSAEELNRCLEFQLDVVVHSEEQVELIEAAESSKSLRVFLKVNSGMNRLGIRSDLVAGFYHRLKHCAAVNFVTAMTHYADADVAGGVDWQNINFSASLGSLSLATSKSNSASLIYSGSKKENWVRPGIMLYGSSPIADVTAASLGLKPAMTLKSKVIAIQHLKAGDRVGYGGTFTAKSDMRIGIVAGGYGDGYPRSAPHGSPILVNGVRVETVGRVSMDTLAVNLTGTPSANVGSDIVLWGEGLPIEELAHWANTISYELLTRVNRRVPFVCSD